MPDARAEAAARARQLELTKPPGSLGRLEDLACWLAARLGEPAPQMPRAQLFVFAADHGVAARGVSAFPQAVTSQMVRNFTAGGAAINVLAALADCHVEVIDVGVASNSPSPAGVRYERVRPGTRDLSLGAAMTMGEVGAAIEVGARCVRESVARGAQLILAGEMGIANTTSAACLICALTGAPPIGVVGRGTGVDDEALSRKLKIVGAAIARVRALQAPSALQLMAELGGLEIAAMTGAYLEAARQRLPILLDGYISAAAALTAVALEPLSREWMLASHRSAEPGHSIALRALELEPLLDLGLRLGEGTGAALVLPIVRAALSLHGGMATFGSAGVSRENSAPA